MKRSCAQTLDLFDWQPTAPTIQPAPIMLPIPAATPAIEALYLGANDRNLASNWRLRAIDNVAAIRLANALSAAGQAATRAEQLELVKFTGFGASDLANNIFRRPGSKDFQPNWNQLGTDLEAIVSENDYRVLERCVQYAHYTDATIIRAMWRAVERLGFTGGLALEPGFGIGLFPTYLPQNLIGKVKTVGVEIDPVSARIASLLHPDARIVNQDLALIRIDNTFDLAIGNPPFSDRIVRSDPDFRTIPLRLHDYFIAKAISLVKPHGLAAFVTSRGTMDKLDPRARDAIAATADLVGAIRLPEGAHRAAAGTDVVTDILFLRKRDPFDPKSGEAWRNAEEIPVDGTPTRINEYFLDHPEMVLGRHAIGSSQFGPAYTCLPDPKADLARQLAEAVDRLPYSLAPIQPTPLDEPIVVREHRSLSGGVADGNFIREGSYVISADDQLMQVIGGQPVAVKIRSKGDNNGIFQKNASIIRKMIPIRDAIRTILTLQSKSKPSQAAQADLAEAYKDFTDEFGPINSTTIIQVKVKGSDEIREQHRHPNIQAFRDDPDAYLVASIEDYDVETNTARPGPIFTKCVIAPPMAPKIDSATDALAVCLNELGRIDLDHVAWLLNVSRDEAKEQLGDTIYLDPTDLLWKPADEYLSGAVRAKLVAATNAAAQDPQFLRNVEALQLHQPEELPPSDISARLGAPWIPTTDIEQFFQETVDKDRSIHVYHTPQLATWTVTGYLKWSAAATTEWGTDRRDAGLLIQDALNQSIPQIHDTIKDANGKDQRVLNVEATEAAKEKLEKLKQAFIGWVWQDPDRADRLARVYNDTYNDTVPRHFDGSHLTLNGASTAFSIYPTQKRVIWRIISSGSTYISHVVGAGKTLSYSSSTMEQRRLGLIAKAMITVPNHCLVQTAREFLALYPTANILVADEENFVAHKRHAFCARAATGEWDAIIISHSAFKFISVPSSFEQEFVESELRKFVDLKDQIDGDDRVSMKRLQRQIEGLRDRLQQLACRKDDLLTLEQIGVDHLVVDEAQEFRKLSFATNMSSLKGIDPNGSQRAWDLYVKVHFLKTINPTRAIVLASGTPITNTMGEMFTIQRIMALEELEKRNLDSFDAWAAQFGEAHTALELQPSGRYAPATRFAKFVNMPELSAMFRSFADVVLLDDLRPYMKLPRIAGGQRQIITAEPSPEFKAYQKVLDARIEAIKRRNRAPQPGDDILLSVITDGRHAAIDLRFVLPHSPNEPDNKLNMLINKAFEIWKDSADQTYVRKDGQPYHHKGAGQLIFSDLGTLAVEEKRGFSAYRWIKDRLIALGVPASQIAIIQEYKTAAQKQGLFNEFNAGLRRFILGSSDKLGTGSNVQLRLLAEHHLDVPWLPSQIEQREGRIVRQGNQHDEVQIYAYATKTSLDAQLWASNERKARFINAALSGDRSIRVIEDIGESQANQFALAKAIASGDPRLMQKAGLEADLGRLRRLRSAHFDEQLGIRRQVASLKSEISYRKKRIAGAEIDLTKRVPTNGPNFKMTVNNVDFLERKLAGEALLRQIRVAQNMKTNTAIGHLGGFDLQIETGIGWREKEYRVFFCRSNYEHDIEIRDSSALGLIAKLEHALSNIERELQGNKDNLVGAEARLAQYEPRLGQPFQYDQDLQDKEAELQAIDEMLEQEGKEAPQSAISETDNIAA